EEKTGRRLDPDLVYECGTLRELAAYLDNHAPALAPAHAPPASEPPRESEVTSSPAAIREWERAPVDTAGPAPRLAAPAETAAPGPFGRFSQGFQRFRRLKEKGGDLFHPCLSESAGAWVTTGGRRMLMLSSYSYLGLSDHPALADAACRATRRFGT